MPRLVFHSVSLPRLDSPEVSDKSETMSGLSSGANARSLINIIKSRGLKLRRLLLLKHGRNLLGHQSARLGFTRKRAKRRTKAPKIVS